MMSWSAPPSRDSNPFATCWTRPGALPFIATTTGIEPSIVVERLARVGWRGQVVGPHGSGKSTLLRSLADLLRERGLCARVVDATAPSDHDFAPADPDPADPQGLLILEGFERLALGRRAAWLRRLHASKVRFVLTSHRVLRGWRAPAAIAQLAADEATLKTLFARLVEERPSPVTLEVARRVHCLQRGNLRAVWFDLYNLHETLTRTERTAPVAASYALSTAAG